MCRTGARALDLQRTTHRPAILGRTSRRRPRGVTQRSAAGCAWSNAVVRRMPSRCPVMRLTIVCAKKNVFWLCEFEGRNAGSNGSRAPTATSRPHRLAGFRFSHPRLQPLHPHRPRRHRRPGQPRRPPPRTRSSPSTSSWGGGAGPAGDYPAGQRTGDKEIWWPPIGSFVAARRELRVRLQGESHGRRQPVSSMPRRAWTRTAKPPTAYGQTAARVCRRPATDATYLRTHQRYVGTRRRRRTLTCL